MKEYKILLLDVDDTLLDFKAAERDGICEVLKAYGEEPDEEKIARYSKLNEGLWKAFERGEIKRDTIMEVRFGRFFAKLGKEVNGPEAEKLYREQLNNSTVIIDGALEILEYLSGKYDLYVITNGVSKTQYNRLDKSGIGRYMKDIFVSEDAGCQKPRKEFFEYCFERLGTSDVSQMLVIGDSLSSDIRGGNNAGIDTCWFNRKGEACPEDITVNYEVRHLEELKKYL